MKRILLVKTSSLGDVIHNLPVVNDILAHHPRAKIDWLVEESFADVPKLHSNVNQVFTVAVRRWRKQLFSKKTWQEFAKLKHTISTQPYDLIIDTQGLIKSAVMTSFATGVKHGMDKKSAREPLASYFYDAKHNIPRGQHAVIRNRALAALAYGYANPDDAPDYGIASDTLESNAEMPAKPFVIGLHGTSRDSKLWPVNHWIDLGNALAKENISLVLPWASDAEHQRAQQIAEALAPTGKATVLPKQSIAQLAAVIKQAHAAVGVDTGLSHLATAMNIPTVAIFTDTNPVLTGVHPGRFASALNLGGIDQTPTAKEVFEALKQIQST